MLKFLELGASSVVAVESASEVDDTAAETE